MKLSDLTVKRKPYDAKFYARQREGSIRAARTFVPLIIQIVNPRSVIDVGCGTGTWLSVFEEEGVKDFMGIDGSHIDKDLLLIDSSKFITVDLCRPVPLPRTFDLVMSLEVAEHIPEEYAGSFVDFLVNLGPVILFSADIPHKGGVGHVNEQWQDYWAHLFNSRGFSTIDCIRPLIWYDEKIAWWYRQNTLLYVENDYLKANIKLQTLHSRYQGFPLRVVHPDLFSEVINPRRMALRPAISAVLFGLLRAIKRGFSG